ncbi:DUF6456 domain-containing protein [Maricaulis sp.]|uniref:DUF6456 domain-containing protein n=1 Tax=Maricaulis sp. TaxID=1486257 RepID=UPI003A8F7E43
MPAPSPDLPRWLRCLAREGAALKPCREAGGGFAVYPGGDRRRRPLARLDAAQVRQALASGLLHQVGDQVGLGKAGRAALRRGQGGAFASQHRAMAATSILGQDGRLQPVEVNTREGTLGRWTAHLDRVERAAAERFCADHARSSLHQQTTRNWELNAPARQKGWRGGPDAAPLAAIAAKDRVMDALAAVGAGLEPVLMAVCIRGEGISAIERRFGWAQRSGRTVLKLALQQLARHYGMTP